MNSIVKGLINEKIFVDTSAWFALMYKMDRDFERISSVYNTLLTNNNSFITTNHIIGETYTLMRYKINENSTLAFDFLNIIESSLRINKIFVTEELEKKACEYLKRYKDRKFSFVDASSFALMEKNNLRYALTLDEHFSVAGFIKI
ncbi:type II toxin-antitoxin system VapC family toxin [Natronospora cellulosivora (SeqCode)]